MAKRDLSGKRYVYWWADGIYFNVRLSDDRPCVLVITGALPAGAKELVAVAQGQRESKLSWIEVMRNLKARGLTEAPELAVGDGSLGFWRPKNRNFPKHSHNVAGSIKRPTCWTSCPRACNQQLRISSMKYICHRREPRRFGLTINF